MAKDGEAVSVIKKKASGTVFLMSARPEDRVEMGKVRETLRGAVDFACWAGCSLQGGSHSREVCAQFPALGNGII